MCENYLFYLQGHKLQKYIYKIVGQRKRGKRKNIRMPQGYQLANRRGKEARYGFGYNESDLQVTKNHRTQHKIDGYGRGKNNGL